MSPETVPEKLTLPIPFLSVEISNDVMFIHESCVEFPVVDDGE
jgi:hypothetical protein